MMPVMEIVLPQMASSVPAFLAKLWKMVDDPETDSMISWGDTGNSFVIHNQSEFSSLLLPYYYKHSNMASFVRQLNMYGFHKVVGVDSGGLKSEKTEEMEFAHTSFLRGQEILLENIKRKVATSKATPSSSAGFVPSIKTEKVTEMLNEVNQLKDKQEDMDGKLETMKKENEALWREVVSLRQKHLSQQKIVNKLIHFLVSLVQPRMHHHHHHHGAVKRRYQPQLAIGATGASSAKEPKLSQLLGSSDDDGPIILDVTHDDRQQQHQEYMMQQQQTPKVETPMSPLSMAMQAVNPSLVNPAISVASSSMHQQQQQQQEMEAEQNKRPVLQREISKEDFDVETMLMQKEIDNLKDILSGQITLDPNIVTNLFNPDEPLAAYFGVDKEQQQQGGSSSMGQQKLQLELDAVAADEAAAAAAAEASTQLDEQPSLFELADIDDDVLQQKQSNDVLPEDMDNEMYPSLETPLVNIDMADTNPLLAQITAANNKKNRKK